MKSATVPEIRKELKHKTPEELTELCLRLSRFKVENKELLTYLLFESDYEEGYITSVKAEIDLQFDAINSKSVYYVKKSIRKILRMVRKWNRYSNHKETEVILLLHFCEQLQVFNPSLQRDGAMINLNARILESIDKKIEKLHEDLRLDYRLALEELQD